MFFQIEIDNDYILEYKLADNTLALRWFVNCLNDCVYNRTMIDKDRFYNFPDDEWSKQRIVDEINRNISVINQYEKNKVKHKAHDDMLVGYGV